MVIPLFYVRFRSFSFVGLFFVVFFLLFFIVLKTHLGQRANRQRHTTTTDQKKKNKKQKTLPLPRAGITTEERGVLFVRSTLLFTPRLRHASKTPLCGSISLSLLRGIKRLPHTHTHIHPKAWRSSILCLLGCSALFTVAPFYFNLICGFFFPHPSLTTIAVRPTSLFLSSLVMTVYAKQTKKKRQKGPRAPAQISCAAQLMPPRDQGEEVQKGWRISIPPSQETRDGVFLVAV
eukprot:gene2225-1388_t